MKIKLDKETGIRHVYWPNGEQTRMAVVPSPFGKGYAVFDNGQLIATYPNLSAANKAAKAMV